MRPLIAFLLSVACALARSPGHILHPGDPTNLQMQSRYHRMVPHALSALVASDEDAVPDQGLNDHLNNFLRRIMNRNPGESLDLNDGDEIPIDLRDEQARMLIPEYSLLPAERGPAYFLLRRSTTLDVEDNESEPCEDEPNNSIRYDGHPVRQSASLLAHSEGMRYEYRPDAPECPECPEVQEPERTPQMPHRPLPVRPWVRDQHQQEFAQGPADPHFADMMARILTRQPPVPPAPLPPRRIAAPHPPLPEVIEPPRRTRQNPTNSRTRTLVAENLERMRSLNMHEDNMFNRLEASKQPQPQPLPAESVFGIALVAAIGAALTIGVFAFAYGWYTLSWRAKAAANVDYPAYGVTGPTEDPGDRKLAHSAHMYHYQHQKQQILALERNGAEQREGSVSEPESEEENEEGDYTVYECPGFATTGDMEVKNPLFLEDPTPATPAASATPAVSANPAAPATPAVSATPAASATPAVSATPAAATTATAATTGNAKSDPAKTKE